MRVQSKRGLKTGTATAAKTSLKKVNSHSLRTTTSPIKRQNLAFLRRSRAVTTKKFTKKCDARAEVHVVLLIKPITFFLFLTFLLPLLSPSSDLKVPLFFQHF